MRSSDRPHAPAGSFAPAIAQPPFFGGGGRPPAPAPPPMPPPLPAVPVDDGASAAHTSAGHSASATSAAQVSWHAALMHGLIALTSAYDISARQVVPSS